MVNWSFRIASIGAWDSGPFLDGKIAGNGRYPPLSDDGHEANGNEGETIVDVGGE